MDFKLSFTDKEITPWSGMLFMKKLLDKTGLLTQLISTNLSIWCGANKFEHLEVGRFDEVLRNIFGFKKMPGHKSYIRYFNKFTIAINQQVFSDVMGWFFSQVKIDNITLDIDSTVLTRYGNQEGSARGYNPQKRGRNSHHPLNVR